MPRAGLIENDNVAKPNPEGAQVLDNFYPTANSIRLRRGSQKHATADDDGTATVGTLATYEFSGTEELFAACDGNIFDVTNPASATAEPAAAVTGQSNDYYSAIQFSSSGGHYLIMANGADSWLQYDGTYWAAAGPSEVVALPYDTETGNFTAGLTVTGGTSAATGVIQRVIDNGTAGTLLLTAVSGTFQDDETITDTSTGSAAAAIPSGVTVVAPVITGVATAALSALWEHKSRIWAVEGGTLSAWYLAVNSRSGTITEFPLNGIFRKGGQLLFGATWSLDSGDGLDDVCLFITDQGEIAVYQGTDPGSASTWALVGVYKIGRPLGKNAFFQAGGDVLVLTDDGIVPVSQAIKKDRAALQAAAITFPIEQLWRQSVSLYNGTARAYEGLLWPQQAMLCVTIPTVDGADPYLLIANSKTGAWARYTGWDARCMALLGDRVFFGTSTGTVVEAEVTGGDQGAAYTGRCVPRFSDFKSQSEKAALSVRTIFKSDRTFTPELFALGDFSEDYPTPGSTNMTESSDVWGTAVWGENVWGTGSTEFTIRSEWVTVNAVGSHLAPGIHITAGIVAEPKIELAALWLRFESGAPL